MSKEKGEPPWPDLAELYSSENCLSYRQGTNDLVYADLELRLPQRAISSFRESVFDRDVCSAFSFRKEFISFKKAFLLLYQQAQRVEKSLRQVSFGKCM